jgi:hypothetical protein
VFASYKIKLLDKKTFILILQNLILGRSPQKFLYTFGSFVIESTWKSCNESARNSDAFSIFFSVFIMKRNKRGKLHQNYKFNKNWKTFFKEGRNTTEADKYSRWHTLCTQNSTNSNTLGSASMELISVLKIALLTH